MDWITTIITAVISAAGGGILGAYLRFRIKERQEDRSDFEAIVATLHRDNETLRKDNEELREENRQLRVRIDELERKELENERKITALENRLS